MSKIENIKLDNGLNIYLYNDMRRHSTFFQFTTKCGGTNKDFIMDGKEYHLHDGVAHILEHYIVECNKIGNFLDMLGEKQMTTNASTSSIVTSYYFEAVENVSYGVKTILEGVNSVIFDDKKLQKLKNPIYQEIRGKMDNKFYHLNRLRMKNLFSNIKYRDVGGLVEEVEKTTIDDLKALYEAFYQPSNQIIFIAGNFDKDEIINEIKEFYDNLKFKKHEIKSMEYNEPLKVNKKEDTLIFPTPLDYESITFKIDVSDYSPEERLDLDFYLNCFYVLFFGVASPLYKKLVDEEVISEGINYGDTKIGNFMLLTIGAYTKDVKRFRESVFNKIKSLDDFNNEKFELKKKNAITRLILRDENIFSMIFPFINNVIDFDYPYVDKVEDIEKTNIDSFEKAIKKLNFSNYTITIIKEKVDA